MSVRIPATAVCVLVGALALGGGCAPHVPVSESVMFHDGATLPSHTNESGLGVAATLAPTRAPARAVTRASRSGREHRRKDLINGRQAGAGLFGAWYDRDGHYAVSGTLGIPMSGLDATLRIRGRNYVTVGVSVPGQGQAFLSHRTFNSPRFGAAVGVGGRYTQYAAEGTSMLAIDTERVASIGARLFGLVREQGHTEGGVKFGTYAGYAPRLHRAVFSLTLTVGQF